MLFKLVDVLYHFYSGGGVQMSTPVICLWGFCPVMQFFRRAYVRTPVSSFLFSMTCMYAEQLKFYFLEFI